MTEAEWLACNDPIPMLEFVREHASERKLRLFAVSAIWSLVVSLGDAATQKVAEVISEVAEGTFTREDLRDERDKIGSFSYLTVPASQAPGYVTRAAGLSLDADPFRAALMMASAVVHLDRELDIKESGDNLRDDLEPTDIRCRCHRRLTSHVRDIFGNPFGSTGIKRQWRTSTALALAEQMYASREFSAMPILADALQDAGCDSESILNHCRGSGPHVRGCWAVDAVLNKE